MGCSSWSETVSGDAELGTWISSLSKEACMTHKLQGRSLLAGKVSRVIFFSSLTSILAVSLSFLCKPRAFCKLSPQCFLQPSTHRMLKAEGNVAKKSSLFSDLEVGQGYWEISAKGNVFFSDGPSPDNEENGLCFEISVFDFLLFFLLKDYILLILKTNCKVILFLHHCYLQITILFFH